MTWLTHRRFLLSLEPLVNGIAADIEVLASFAFGHAIELDGIHHFLSQVVTTAARQFSAFGLLLQTMSSLIWPPP